MGRCLRHQLQRSALFADREQFQPAILDPLDRLLRPWIIIGPDHSSAFAPDDLVKQPHLGLEIAVHIAVIIKMIAAQIGKGADLHGQTFGAILRKAVAGCFKNRVADPFARQTGHVGEKGDNIGRRQPGLDLVVGGGDAKRADRRAVIAIHPPQLAGEFGGGRLAIGTGNRSHMGWRRSEIARRHLGEQSPRLLIRNMHRAFDARLGERHDGDRARSDRGLDKLFTVKFRAPESTENIAGRDLAMVDGKTGDALLAGIALKARDKTIQSHCSLPMRIWVSTATASAPTHRHRDVRRE